MFHLFHCHMRVTVILLLSCFSCKAFTISSTRSSLLSHAVEQQQRLYDRRRLGMSICRMGSLTIRISKNDINNINNMVTDDEPYEIKPPIPSCSIVIREATEGDIPIMAKILTDGFHRETTNFFTYPVMRLDTFINQTFRFSDRIGARYGTFVACHATADGKVVGCCEVDDALTKGEIDPAPRPYMCNLAVDKEFRRMGVAGALVLNSERVVRTEYERSLLHLRMREGNQAAFDLYVGLGYRVQSKYVNAKDETVLLMAKTLDPVE